jgi:hypothetical protein
MGKFPSRSLKDSLFQNYFSVRKRLDEMKLKWFASKQEVIINVATSPVADYQLALSWLIIMRSESLQRPVKVIRPFQLYSVLEAVHMKTKPERSDVH